MTDAKLPDADWGEHRPQLRWPLDIQYSEYSGRPVALVRDPLGVAADTAIVPTPLMPILGRFDGAHTIRQIVAEGEEFGLTESLLRTILEQLDQFYLLENERARERFDAIKTAYRTQPIREASHAGLIYPTDPEALRREIHRFRDQAEPHSNGAAANSAAGKAEIVAFVAPHIDYQRGWRTYGAGYRVFEAMQPPDVIFLLGTAHQPADGYFHLTDKHFATPFGIVPTHQEIVHEIAQAYGKGRAFKHEILHRREHSLDLQMPFIAARFAKNGTIAPSLPTFSENSPMIVPILVGSFHRFLTANRSPTEEGEVAEFIAILADITKRLRISGRRVLFYGGVDLAHVGRYFGDADQVSDSHLPQIETRDRELLDGVLRGDEDHLFAHIAEDGDRRRICGFPSIFTMLAALRRAGVRARGTLVDYRQAVNRETDCSVTFASAYWEAA